MGKTTTWFVLGQLDHCLRSCSYQSKNVIYMYFYTKIPRFFCIPKSTNSFTLLVVCFMLGYIFPFASHIFCSFPSFCNAIVSSWQRLSSVSVLHLPVFELSWENLWYYVSKCSYICAFFELSRCIHQTC